MISKFFTGSNLPVPAVTTEEMIEIDRIAVEETGPNLFQMMENAGRNLALSAIDILGKKWQSAKIIVLCGTGGNGGGGICAARHLANRNIDVKICITDINKLKPVTLFQKKVFNSTKGAQIEIEELQKQKPDLIIDAIIGYSLKVAPTGNSLKMINWVNNLDRKILSLDVPSGVNTNDGSTPGEYIKTDRTLTLALPKTGLLPDLTGELFLADIGIPFETYSKMNINYQNPFGNKFIVKLSHRKNSVH